MALSLLIAWPAFAALLTLFCPLPRAARAFAAAAACLPLGLFAFLWAGFDTTSAGFQYYENIPLFPEWGVSYSLGMDGVSLWLVGLTCFLIPLVCIGSWRTIQEKERGYYAAVLFLESAVLGTFLALDLLLFYVFWELMLIPMFFLIGLWGGENRLYATVKFVLFTLAGSLVLLVALLVVGNHAGGFDYQQALDRRLPSDWQIYCFLAFAFAFLIKVPSLPFHTWLPDAHTEAPAGGSVILAGLLLKAGAYGLVRFCLPLFPDAARGLASFLVFLGAAGILYGALAAARQQDFKRLIAYSSVSHMGFILVGVFTLDLVGLQGSLLQMVNHGITTGALFFLAGMIYDRRHTRRMEDFRGLAHRAPWLAFAFLWTALASAGLPGLNGFVGEFLILSSAWREHPAMTAASACGVILGAWYLFRLYDRLFLGPLEHEENKTFEDLNRREVLVLVPLMALMLWIGVRPGVFLSAMEKTVHLQVLETMKPPPPMLDFAVEQRLKQEKRWSEKERP